MNKDKKEGAVYIMLEKKEKDSLDTEKLYNTKVGITSQDGYAGRKKRLSGIKVGNPREVTMEYYSVYFKHYKPFEKVIHEYLKNKKRYIRGEWFLLSGLEIMMLSDTIDEMTDFDWEDENVTLHLEDLKIDLGEIVA